MGESQKAVHVSVGCEGDRPTFADVGWGRERGQEYTCKLDGRERGTFTIVGWGGVRAQEYV